MMGCCKEAGADFRVTMGKPEDFRPALEIEAEEFIPVRSMGTKGKRITPNKVAFIEEIEPLRQPEPAEEAEDAECEEEDSTPSDPESRF